MRSRAAFSAGAPVRTQVTRCRGLGAQVAAETWTEGRSMLVDDAFVVGELGRPSLNS
jgi:hypothetical protein